MAQAAASWTAQRCRFFFFFVLDEDTATQIPNVVGVSDSGRPFLRTEFDGKATNNLSALPEYPNMQP